MKKYFIVISLLFLTLTQAQEKKWTLQACVDYAHQHNLQLKQSELDIAQAEINKTSTQTAYLPTINTNTSASWSSGLTKNYITGVNENQTTFGGNGSIRSNLNLFSGFKNKYNYKKSLLDILSAEYQYADLKKSIDMQIASAFMQILLAKESLSTVKQQLENSIQQKDKTAAMIQAGVLPKGDLIDAEAQITNDNLQIIQAENNYEIAKLNLAQLLEFNDPNTFKIDEDLSNLKIDANLLTKSSKNLYNQALQTSDKIKSTETQGEIAQYQVKLAKSSYLPALSAFANVNTGYSDREGVGFGGVAVPADPFGKQIENNLGASYGLSLNIPILNGLNVKHQVKSAKLNIARTNIALETNKKNLKNDIYKMKTDLVAAFQSLKAAEANLKAQLKSYNYANEKFKVGILNIFDLNNIKTQYVAAQNSYINAKYQYYMKSKILEYTIK